MTDTHQVYPNAPVSLVAVEIRFPTGSGPSQAIPTPLQRSFKSQLGEAWVIEQVRTSTLAMSMGPGGPGPQSVEFAVIPRFTVRDRTMAIAVTPEALTIEATRYEHYPTFRKVLELAFETAAKVLLPEGVARVGMRYIDEIRVPEVDGESPQGWGTWVDPELMPPHVGAASKLGLDPKAWEGAVQYRTGPDRTLIFRFAPRVGYAVNPEGPLKRPSAPPPGPLFMLDFDSFWQPPDIPEFDADALLGVCDELRVPIRTLFDLLIPERLVQEVFMKEPSHG